MKKLLLLILMTLLSATAVDAALVYLRFSSTQGGSGVSGTLTGQLPQGSISTTWVYTCKGSDLSSYVSDGKVGVRVRANQDGVYDYYVNDGVEYTNSGDSKTFYKYNDESVGRYAKIVLPANYTTKTFIFTVYSLSGGNNVSLKVQWTDNIQFMSDLDNDNNFTGSAYDSYDSSTGEYTWTWTRSDLSGKSEGDKLYFYLYNADNTTSYGCYSGHSPFEMTNFTEGGGWYECNEGSNKFFVTHTEGNSYVIKAKYETNSAGNNDVWKIHVDVDAPIKLTSTIDSWRGTKYESEDEDNGVYTWTWTKQQLSGYAEGAKLEFYLTQGSNNYGSYDHSGANEYDMTNSSGWYECKTGSTYHFYVTYSKGNTYTIQAKKNGSNWDVQLITIDGVHDYYWVSPQITNNQKWEYFKMVPSRNRSRNGGDGKTSTKYFSFTIKDSDLKKWDGTAWSDNEIVEWYIVRDDEARWYRPESDTDIDVGYNDNGTVIDNQTHNDRTLGDFHYSNYMKVGTVDPRTGCFTFQKGGRLSYTFILNAKPSGEGNLGNVFINTPVASAPSTSSTKYYLIGNFTSATGAIDIDEKDQSHEMTQLWYKSGKEYNTDNVTDAIKASPDSVVYEYNVSRPREGWGDLYLDIAPAGQQDWTATNTLGPQYRPLISMGNNLDGRALVGGLTGYNSDQSLNPEPSEFYSGYTFRFNATTMTYNLKFHSSLYLVGEAVRADGKGGSWNLSTAANQENYLIPLKATQETNHFRNKVTFKNGKGFRFLVKEDENTDAPYNKNWGEDANAPTWATGENAAAYPHYVGTDTQYKNYLQYNTGNTSKTDPTDDGTANVVFDLPDGEYTINFFNYGENSYYTIEREAELRDMNDVVYKGTKRTILGRGGYNFFRVWSDYIAWNKPEDVDVYVVTNFSPSGGANEDFDWHAASITLTKKNINYIPANTGVILAMKTDKNSLKGGMYYDEVKEADKATNTGYNNAWMQMTPYTEPGATVDNKGVLIPLYQATNLQRYEGEGSEEKANYLFGFYRANRVIANYTAQEDFLLGFWQTTGVGNTYPNSAFLQLTREQSDALGVGASYTVSEGGSGAPAFMLLFDDSGSDTVTGITDVNVQTPAQQLTNDHWYTLEGVRISAPTTKGIYIHGGKKVIVR